MPRPLPTSFWLVLVAETRIKAEGSNGRLWVFPSAGSGVPGSVSRQALGGDDSRRRPGLCQPPAAEAANFTCSWNDATANWTTVADWSTCNSTFPNNGAGNTYDATISTGDPTLTTAITIGSVTITSPGAWTLTGSGAAANLSGSVANSGTVALGGTAALTVTGGFTNSGGLDVDVGNFDGGGNLTISGTLANTKTVQLGSINANAGAANTLTLGGLNNANTGTIGLFGNAGNPANQAKVTVNGQASNAGTINIPTNSSLTVTGAANAYTQTAGFTNLSSGSLAAPNVNINGGTLQGMGTVTGALNVAGAGTIQAINLANGSLAGMLTVDGNYSQSGGTFDAPLHGTGIQIDKVAVTNGHTVTLTGGDLDPFGVTFAKGQEFDDIMTFQPNQLTGTFATILGGGNGVTKDLGNGLTLEAFYNNGQGNISLEVVPTPPPGKIWNDGTGNWTTDPNKWTAPGAPQPTDDVIIGMTTNGNVTLNNDSTIDSLHMTVGNLLTVDSGSTLSVAAVPSSGANGGNSVALDSGSTITLGGTLNTGGTVLVNSGANLGLSGGTIMGATLAGPGTIQTNPNQTGTLQSVTIFAGATFAGQTGSMTTLAGMMVNNGTLDAAGGTINATTGFNGTGTARIDPGGTMIIGANSTVGTLTHNGTGAASLSLGGNNVTVSADYTNANSGTGNSFNKLANVATTGGQILAAGPNPANMQVITGPNVTGGNTTTPTLNLGIVHVGDSATYQIANQGTAANPSLRGAIQTDVNGGNITGSLLTGTGVTAANFGPIAPGASTIDFTVTAAAPGLLAGQAVHFANNFSNVPEQTMSFSASSQINLFAALAFLKEGGQGSLSGDPTDGFVLNFGDVAQNSSQEAMLAILNDNPLADQLFTDLLSTDGDGSMGPFTLTGCSVKDLPGGETQGGCDASFDTSNLGDFTVPFPFPVESSNSSGFDQVIGTVTLTIEGDVGPTRTPEPGTITLLGSGLGVLLLVVRRRRRTGSGWKGARAYRRLAISTFGCAVGGNPCSGGRLYRPFPRQSLGSERD
jgi:hypothetical protein